MSVAKNLLSYTYVKYQNIEISFCENCDGYSQPIFYFWIVINWHNCSYLLLDKLFHFADPSEDIVKVTAPTSSEAIPIEPVNSSWEFYKLTLACEKMLRNKGIVCGVKKRDHFFQAENCVKLNSKK